MGMASAVETKAKETGRIEAFSDGVFAFAITLLVLYLKDLALSGGGGLLQGLLNQWPTFFAFVTSFMTSSSCGSATTRCSHTSYGQTEDSCS